MLRYAGVQREGVRGVQQSVLLEEAPIPLAPYLHQGRLPVAVLCCAGPFNTSERCWDCRGARSNEETR